MTLREAADEPFFREWKARGTAQRRSLERARKVASSLGLNKVPIPLLTVVGSKGKATTAIYASATLASAGLRVGTLTSPPILTNRERLRIDGKAISPSDYQGVSDYLSRVLPMISDDGSDGGYLSPSGLFTMMGLRWMIDSGCDAAILEAGMGGRSDEVSLFSPLVVAITKIFGEHLGILGNNVREIADDKAGVIGDGTRAVLTTPQTLEVKEVLQSAVSNHDCSIDFVASEDSAAKNVPVPPGLSGLNAWLGIHAARRFLQVLGQPSPDHVSSQRVLSSIRTPGRLSIHTDRDNRTWIVDAAIDESGVVAALDWVKQNLGKIDMIVVSIPSGKDVTGVRRALANEAYVAVSLETEHLEFSDNEWGADLVPFTKLGEHITGQRILAIGTWSFVGAVLSEIGVNYETAFLP